ncbi:MAG: MFS transporter [Deltaproteobacteria bacterium]|jgi:AAA family ATP:ADP antiporter|nr:MFS transporter [Deltaproteobacteria bacterium]
MTTENKNIITRFMKSASKVESNEIKAVVLSFSFAFTLMASYYILRPIRDAMASDWSDAELSTLFTATFVFSFVVVALYGAACSRIRIGRLVPGIYGLFALSFFGFYLAIQASPDTPINSKVFYVWISIFSLFNVSVFWSFMADIFNKEQARRLFGFIASGSSIGALIGPLLALTLVGRVGKGNLLLISTVLLLVPMIIIGWLEQIKHTELHNEELNAEQDYQQTLGSNPLAGFMLFVRNPYLLGIGIFILLYTAISTLVYFELKNLMAGLDESTRTQIWAGMDLAVNILTIGTAMFFTSRLATRFGLAVTLAFVPVIIFAGLLVVAMAPMIWVVVALQVVRRAGNYGITRPGREMLFTAVDRESRFKAKSVIDIVVYRGGDMITAWAFTGLTQGLGLGLGAVAFVGTLIAGVWAFVGHSLGRNYDQSHGETSSSEPAEVT